MELVYSKKQTKFQKKDFEIYDKKNYDKNMLIKEIEK
jgi:hypothetical protein